MLGISGAMAAAIAVLLVSSFWFTQPAEGQKAAETMARGAEAVSNPSTVHIVTKMRTPPNDNFGLIITDGDLVGIEAWRQFGDQPKWRLEEPGRVVVMDGKSTLQLMRPNIAMKLPSDNDDWGPVLQLTKVQDMITRELRTALAKGWDLKLTHETTAAGEKQLVVSVDAKSGLPDNDHLKNKYLDLADAHCVYRFDAKTQRLEGFDAYLHQPGGDLLVLTIGTSSTTSPSIRRSSPSRYRKTVSWYKETERLPDNEKYEKMTPKEAARAFFERAGKRTGPRSRSSTRRSLKGPRSTWAG